VCVWLVTHRLLHAHKMAFQISDFPITSFQRTSLVANYVVVHTCMTQELEVLNLAVRQSSRRRLKLLLQL